MRHLCLALSITAVAGPSLAETPLNSTEFDAYVTGNTITYDYGDGLFGTEEYLEDRKVRWAFEGDRCVYGTWYQEKDNICFLYDNSHLDPFVNQGPVDTGPACWKFFLRNNLLHGEDMGPEAYNIVETQRTSTPLPCAEP
ncbi:hypothetical protein [Tabrizicola sp.]|uniref:hypothetical protein n=1 Tax=Tabrizicola sp. TaxID=2005166 RepID=UPI003F33A229